MEHITIDYDNQFLDIELGEDADGYLFADVVKFHDVNIIEWLSNETLLAIDKKVNAAIEHKKSVDEVERALSYMEEH